MIVDWHTHVWEPSLLGAEWGPELDANVNASPSEWGEYDSHRRAMQGAGVDASVVIALVSIHLGLNISNEYVAGYVEESPGSAIGVASVDPNDPHAVARLHEAAKELGMKGVKLSPPYQDFHPHSDAAWRVYEAAAELGLFMIFHQGGVFSSRGTLEVANPVLLDRVAKSFRSVPIIVAHMGQPWVSETIAVMFKNPNVYADLSARFSRPWQIYNILLGIRDYGVSDRILFGSDFPIFDPSDCLRQFRAMAEQPPQGLEPIPGDLIESIINERPPSLLGLEV